jgi:hypothetical protein
MGGPGPSPSFQHDHRITLTPGANVKVGIGHAHPFARDREARGVAPLSNYLEGESQCGQDEGGEQELWIDHG